MVSADVRHSRPALQEKLLHLQSLRGGPTIELTIRPAYHELLRRLGDPHLNLPPVIHVAGTNGKGSTIATQRAVLEAAGYRVHAYTSPHLRRFNERIRLAGAEIDDDALEAYLDEVTLRNGDLPLTFFEITTAMAFLAFARTKADAVLLETGLGGRLDSTNVVPEPAATVITVIGFDHQEFLGHTLPLIAAEKAGIMKKGAPCIVARQSSASVDDVFAQRAAELPCKLLRAGKEWSAEADGGKLRFRFGEKEFELELPALHGRHQIRNAGGALAGLLAAERFELPERALREGLQAVRWPGRLQRIDGAAPPGWELWIDGAHNENGAQALGQQLQDWRAQDSRKLHLVFGIMQRKDVAAFLRPLLPHADSLTAVPISGEPLAHGPETLPAALKAAGIPAPVFAGGLNDAVRRITTGAETPGRILVTGSLYLAGEALGLWERPESAS